MNLITAATSTIERLPLPDFVARAGISYLVNRTARRLKRHTAGVEAAFVTAMESFPIASNTEDANRQHYELPAAFFGHILGPRRKYSCCLYEHANDLATAEERALAQTCLHADLTDGQEILELGCGWGSLTLYMAERYPQARILAVSNSASQREYIEGEAARRGFTNLRVITADMNEFTTDEQFDRIVSVEMFEHMANWVALFQRVREWVKFGGRVFIHVFAHRNIPYRFDAADGADWIGRHFFSGGIMPSNGLIGLTAPRFVVEAAWRWSGENYRRTAEDWLDNFDRNRAPIDAILREVYGPSASLWRRRWRLFFLATSGLFGAQGGNEWGVSHYRLRPR
jgi:cyclopropane-fatty-acyl-phospholipid synthase